MIDRIDMTEFNFQYANLALMIGGQILFVCILAFIFMFGQSPRTSILPDSVVKALGGYSSSKKIGSAN